MLFMSKTDKHQQQWPGEHGFMKIKVLCENHSGHRSLKAEHGLSLLVEHHGARILFDTGNGDNLIKNGIEMGIELEAIETIVLSHGHYDHTGGLSQLIPLNQHSKIVAHPFVLSQRYSCHPDKPVRSIGIPIDTISMLHELGHDRLRLTSEPVALCEDISTTGFIARHHSFEDTGGPFYLDTGQLHPDIIPDDQAIWIKREQGIVVILGCCHAGLINTLEQIQKQANGEPIVGIVGGLHLIHASETRLAKTIAYLKALKPTYMALGHCTGDEAIGILCEQLTDTEITTLCVGRELVL